MLVQSINHIYKPIIKGYAIKSENGKKIIRVEPTILIKSKKKGGEWIG